MDCIRSIPFVGLVDFDDNLINDPVDNEVPLLRISIAVPSVIPSASIDINLPFVASLDCIRSIPFCGSTAFDETLMREPVCRAVLALDISKAMPSIKLSPSIETTLPPVAKLAVA